MALTAGNTSAYNSAPGSTNPFTWSHNHNIGSNGYLVIFLAIPSGSVNSVTYDGVSMTEIRSESPTVPATIGWSIWGIDNPSTGSNTVSVTLNSQNWNSSSGAAFSYLGSSGSGVTGYNGIGEDSPTLDMTISSNSIIIAAGASGLNNGAFIEIPDGTSRSLDYNHTINNYTWGADSPTLSSGTKTVQAGTIDGSNTVLMAVEIKEASTATRRIIII